MDVDTLKSLIRSVIKEVLSELSASQLQQGLTKKTAEEEVIDYQEKVLTESKVNLLARNHCSTIRLSKKVVITPLAKDRVRQFKIKLERV